MKVQDKFKKMSDRQVNAWFAEREFWQGISWHEGYECRMESAEIEEIIYGGGWDKDPEE